MEGACGADREQSKVIVCVCVWGNQAGSDLKSLARGSSLVLCAPGKPGILFRGVTGLDLEARHTPLATAIEVGW